MPIKKVTGAKISKKITKKGAVNVSAKPTVKEVVIEEVVEDIKAQSSQMTETGVKAVKKCTFCVNKKVPTYTDSVSLRRFVNDRAKIVPRARTGTCSKHQRILTKQIKYARHLSLLPFVPAI